VEPFALLTGLLGGLALFLYGLDQMAGALKAVAGDGMKAVLGRLAGNRLVGVLSGAFVTAVIQSSSVTTVLVVGFVGAGLMSLAQSIGVIMGANIGTTVTAQVIAFDVTRLALLMVALGFGLLYFVKRERVRDRGRVLFGLGLVFFGMTVMAEAMAPLRANEGVLRWMAHMEHPALGIVAGAIFTALVQSSSATTGIVITMARSGLVSLPAGIALSFGANVGTCVTAVLASVGKPRVALRAAVVHVVFNLAGVVVWVAFIDRLAAFVLRMTPGAGIPRQIANAHTVFNVANTALFIGLASPIVRLVEWLVPDRRPAAAELPAPSEAKYLDPGLLDTPALALDRARLEILRIGDRVRAMLDAILPAVLEGPDDALDRVEAMDDAVDGLHGEVVTYLGRISQTALGEAQTHELVELMGATNDLEAIGDIIETNLVQLGHQRIRRHVAVSEATRTVIEGFHRAVVTAADAALLAVTRRDEAAARVVTGMKAEINRLADSAALHEARRLVAREPNRLPAYAIETDVIENLKRIYYFTKRMARAVVREQPPPA